MLILAQSSNFWEAMTFLFPYLFVVALMSILAALGWDAGARTSAEPLLEDDSEAAMAHKLRSYSAPMLMLLNPRTAMAMPKIRMMDMDKRILRERIG